MQTRADCAVVIGASVAGLCAARVLSDHFARVIVIERDLLPDAASPRRGVPHGRHLHGLLAGGLAALEQLFPGFARGAELRGGLLVDVGNFATWYADGIELPALETGLTGLLMTRPLLEQHLRTYLTASANVSILSGAQASGLAGSAWKVTGVQVVDASGTERLIESELVIDASGRGGALATWLARFGLPQPDEDTVRMELTYTSCLIRRKSQHLGGRLGLVYPPTAPVRRAGAALAVEGDRYIVTLMGYLGERSPRTFQGMVEYARTLPVPGLYELLRDAEPLGDPSELRDPASVRRRYERLKHLPEGVLPLGDALCSINPSHGHGMTIAAREAQCLGRALEAGLRGLSTRFFEEVTPLIDVPWSIVAGADFEYEGVTGSAERPPPTIMRYFKRAARAAVLDREVALAVYRVMHLVEPPSVLFSPAITARVLASAPESDATIMLTPEGDGAL
jgi:2-polyprenyl-6-methoxyphenol hydroxylase-like FAD-dependent oxidoreductase